MELLGVWCRSPAHPRMVPELKTSEYMDMSQCLWQGLHTYYPDILILWVSKELIGGALTLNSCPHFIQRAVAFCKDVHEV